MKKCTLLLTFVKFFCYSFGYGSHHLKYVRWNHPYIFEHIILKYQINELKSRISINSLRYKGGGKTPGYNKGHAALRGRYGIVQGEKSNNFLILNPGKFHLINKCCT